MTNEGKVHGLKEGDQFESLYNFGDITDRDKKLIEEVVKVLKTSDNIPVKEIEKKIKEKFEIDEIPIRKLEDTNWYKVTKNFDLHYSAQGYKIIVENGNKIRVPLYSISVNVDTLNDITQHFFDKFSNIK